MDGWIDGWMDARGNDSVVVVTDVSVDFDRSQSTGEKHQSSTVDGASTLPIRPNERETPERSKPPESKKKRRRRRRRGRSSEREKERDSRSLRAERRRKRKVQLDLYRVRVSE